MKLSSEKTTNIKLYSYWRSTASYRVRIALGLKGLDYEYVPVHLVKEGGEQHSAEFRALNPNGLVPTLADDDVVLSQSYAIINYLEKKYPDTPLYTADTIKDAEIESLAQSIACDIHPLNNLRVLKYLSSEMEISDSQRDQWYQHWVAEGFKGIERRLSNSPTTYALTNRPSVADIYLVAQVYNAHRFNCDMTPYTRINELNDLCLQLPAFEAAIPENQPDAE